MRAITNAEVENAFFNDLLNKDGLSREAIRRHLERAALLDDLRNANNIAHLKPIIQYLLERV